MTDTPPLHAISSVLPPFYFSPPSRAESPVLEVTAFFGGHSFPFYREDMGSQWKRKWTFTPAAVSSFPQLPRTERFSVGSSYPAERFGHCSIFYQGWHFGHAWVEPEGPHAGKWTFNSGEVACATGFRPAEYWHESLSGLLEYLERTFAQD